MRSLIIAALVFIAGTVAAEEWEPTRPVGWVMSYECSLIDPGVTGFSCSFDADGMTIKWNENPKDMPTDKKRRAMHDFYKLGFAFFDYGGATFDEVAPNGKGKVCHRPKTMRTNFVCNFK